MALLPRRQELPDRFSEGAENVTGTVERSVTWRAVAGIISPSEPVERAREPLKPYKNL